MYEKIILYVHQYKPRPGMGYKRGHGVAKRHFHRTCNRDDDPKF